MFSKHLRHHLPKREEGHTFSRVMGSIRGVIPVKNAFIHHLKMSALPNAEKLASRRGLTACW